MLVHVRTASASTHNLCFRTKIRKVGIGIYNPVYPSFTIHLQPKHYARYAENEYLFCLHLLSGFFMMPLKCFIYHGKFRYEVYIFCNADCIGEICFHEK